MTSHFLHRLLRLAVPLLALSLLSACSAESDERQAFTEFLQTRILDKPGVRLPKLNEDDKKRIGRYVAHYEVIVHHNDELAAVMKPVESTIRVAERMRTLDAVMNGGTALGEARTGMAEHRRQLASRLEQSERERAALSQPEDLKPVFDAAYRRTVTEPTALVDTQIGLMEEVLGRYEALATYLDSNRAVIRVSGMTAEVTDPRVQAEVQARMAAIEAMRQPLVEVQGKLRKLIQGA